MDFSFDFAENVFGGTALGGCVRIKASRGYLTEHFSADTFKEERTIDISLIRSKFIKHAVRFSYNLISRHFHQLLMMAVHQFLNTSELKSYFPESLE